MTYADQSIEPGDKFKDFEGVAWTAVDSERLSLDADPALIRPLDLIAEQGLRRVESDAPPQPQQSPDYYVFPGGVQVIDISRHLTSNAGQAVQYIARSSRIDGVTKGDQLPDLRKAADMIADEIARLEAA